MLHVVGSHTAVAIQSKRRTSPLGKKLCAIIALAAATLWLTGCSRIEDLGASDKMAKAGVYAGWAKGEIVVLVRHAERCDRSENACLADADGITVKGSEASKEVGQGIKSLGLEHTTILASPETRTKQTAYYMFGKAGTVTRASPASSWHTRNPSKTWCSSPIAVASITSHGT
jgi:hypothetical protein